MYSLNVPVPNAVRRLAADLQPLLTPFDRVRERHTLLCKRFDGERSPHRLREQVADILAGVEPFRVRVTEVDAFHDPPTGSSPVVYLAVEGPELQALHERLVAAFDAVDELEGDDYTPHVTLARGLDSETTLGVEPRRDPVGTLRDHDTDSVAWTVDEVGVWSREHEEFVSRLSLPQ